MHKQPPQPETRIVIIGVGLIGGSIAASARQRFPGCRISGIGRSRSRLQAAQQIGLLDDWSMELEAGHVAERCIVVVCLPVDMIADSVLEGAALATDDVLITDAGSVKSCICDRVSRDDRAARLFVGAHPIAGSERSGFEFADANLYEGRPCIVTHSLAAAEKTERTVRFWSSIGCHVTRMTASEHDHLLARTSHLPHVLAAIGAACVAETQLPFTGSGFRDTTRVAAGSASLWRRILSCNRDEVAASIMQAEQRLAELRRALENNDADAVERQLEAAAHRRSLLDAGS